MCSQKLPPERIGKEFRANTITEHDQSFPSVSSIGNDGEKFIITWQSEKQDKGESYGIYFQAYNSSDGSKIGNETMANEESQFQEVLPFVTTLGKDGEKFIITWSTVYSTGAQSIIYAQIFDSNDLSKIGEPIKVHNDTESLNKKSRAFAIGQDGGKFVITWQRHLSTSDTVSDTYARMFNSTDGSTIENEFRVNTYTTKSQENPAISAIGQDGEKFVITWESKNQDGSDYGVYAQMFNSADGSTIENEFRVNTYTTKSQENPAISAIGQDGEKFVITWESENQDGSDSGIYAQMFNSADGSPIGNEFQVNNLVSNSQENSAVVDLKNDLFAIIWSTKEIYLQIFDENTGAKLLKEDFLVNNCTAGEQSMPEIALIDKNNGKFVVAWRSNNQDKSGYGIFAQILNNTILCDCDEGYYSNYMNPNRCDGCEPGSFQNETGQTNCMQCAAGSYSNGNAFPTCTKCAKGTFSTVMGSTTMGHCENCTIGDYSGEEGLFYCTHCSRGSYADQEGSSSCHKCAKGYYGPNVRSTTIEDCQICPNGTYSDEEGSPICFNCPEGTYQNQNGSSSCHKCPIGTYNPNVRSKSIEDCHNCNHGTYSDEEGLSLCLDCSRGTYQNQEGSSNCSECPRGTYNPNEGSTSMGDCHNCPRGTFNTVQGMQSISDCTDCDRGTYQNLEGKSFCNDCGNGTYNPNKGSTSKDNCLMCEIGTYNDLEGATTCILCGIGQYNDLRGLGECTECLPGSFTESEGSTSCQFCQEGEYQDKYGQIKCNDCPFNTWQSNVQSKECKNCPLFSETLSRKSQTVQECFCKLGYYGKNGENCQPCPDEGICNKFNQHYPLPRQGYWSSNENPIELIKCTIEESCPGYATEQCNDELGYTGEKCTQCLVGFYKLENKCEKCPDNSNQRLFLILSLFFLIIVILLLIARKATSYFGSFTITFSFLQLLSIIYKLDIDFPVKWNITMDLFKPFELNLDFLATECSFNFSYYEKWFIIELSPFIFLFFFLIIYIIVRAHSKIISVLSFKNIFLNKCPNLMNKPSKSTDNKFMYYFKSIKYILFSPLYQSLSNRELKDLRNIIINVYLTLLTLLYLILAQKSLEIFNCQFEQSSQKYLLSSDSNYYCFDSTWFKILPFGIIFTILNIVGTPSLIVYLLIKNSKKLNEKEFDLKFGLLCSRYYKNFFFWEIIIMVRKLFIVIIEIFLSNHTTISLIFMLFVIIAFLLLQFSLKPYIEKRHNTLESFLLISIVVILFSSLTLNSSELKSDDSIKENITTALIILLILGILFIIITTLLDITQRLKINKFINNNNNNNNNKNNNKNNKKKKKNSKEIEEFLFNDSFKFKKILNQIHNKKINLLLLLKWLRTLNNSKSQKIKFIFLKIFNHINKNKKLKNIKSNSNLAMNNIYQNDVILKFLKWYNDRNTSNVAKIKINIMIENFLLYEKKNKNKKKSFNIK
ncbi:insulin-like growth factor binding protein [Anaeramoeba flamelloides]|uniref:Insulin-like growth factor binding protein n=1 Tax=Anaeramoeba flamelloides TaxID=1746091 RepID=A0ABQ8XS89_9EUKA|nr:insulin-like growth factor binding protein [Anaeramoeba flamelloides]